MPLTHSFNTNNKRLEITVTDRFDFSLHREFRDAYRDYIGQSPEVVIDLNRAEYMDSSALGMMLLMREQLGGDAARITISTSSPEIRRILDIANFGKLFNLA